MVLIAPFVGAAVFLSGLAAALPTNSYDSSSSSSSNSNYGSSGDSSSNYGSSSSSSNSNYGSSDSSNSYGSSSGNSNYGGSSNSDSGSSYGNSGSNYGGNNYDSSSSTMNMDSTSTMNMDSSTMNMNMDSSTMNMDSTSTTSSYNSYSTPSYGSGSNYWGGSGYEDCVNQCVAQFGGSTGGGGSYQATATSGSYGSKGTGATHTVIVAPTKGVFRMMPFATNASVGDTIEFHWGADQHTVTKSSALLPCNKSSEAPVFASGEQNQSFVFTQVVNDTNPTFYYCGTPTHCEKGMFGIINPAMAAPGSPSSLGGMMQSMAANDSDLSAYAAYSSNKTANNDAASNWGANFDMSSLPDWSHSLVATNVLFTRATLGMNTDILNAAGTVDLSSVANVPLMLPMDISAPLNAASAPQSSAAATDAAVPTPAGAAATDPAAASSSSSASAPPPTKSNGASAVASPRLLVGAAVVLATIFAL